MKSKFIIQLPGALILLAVIISMFQPVLSSLLGLSDSINIILKSIDKIVFVPLFLIAMIKVIRNKRMITEANSHKLFIIMIMISIFSSLLNSHNYSASIFQFLLTYQGIILFFIILQLGLTYNTLRQIFKCLNIIGCFSIFIACIELLSPEVVQNFLHSSNLKEMATVRGDFRSIQSIFPHPEMFAWFMGFLFATNFAHYLCYKDKNKLLICLIFFIFVLISLRRKSIAACVMTSIIGILISNKSKNNKYSLMMLVSIFIAASLMIFSEQVIYLYDNTMSRYLFNEGYYTPRNILLGNSILIANQYFPFGSGLGTYGSWLSTIYYSPLYTEYGMSSNYGMTSDFPIFLTDTYWPMIIAELGWFGVFIFMFFWGGLFKAVKLKIKKSTYTEYQYVMLASALVLLQLLIESSSSPSLSRSPQIFIVMVIVGASLSLDKK